MLLALIYAWFTVQPGLRKYVEQKNPQTVGDVDRLVSEWIRNS